ncbi:polysaccharide biosynthesis/export family protein [uncultured Jannaschia sp.]|uniref:polysaccharide biosynthesis/export family protein n=1 Tax=uncultured Jannaschia sp. TaxID=293347 RepID=UPI002603474E|nr:polysaccharide biosynthesis/export family protein [uncultured Jannaschia sp.]
MPRSFAMVAVTLATMLWAVPSLGQTADPGASELLAPRQMVDIRIGRWDPLEETYTAWSDIGGEVRIAPDGTLSLPLVGIVSAAGMSPQDLGDLIAVKLADSAGLNGRVEASVRITEFQPIYVTGDVRSPGTHPYFPSMTVAQAIGQAGGIDDPGPELLRGDRGALTALGTYRLLDLERQRRLATIARLRAEMEDRPIEVPPEVAAAPLGAALIEREREILRARRASLASSLAQLDELEALISEQVTRLTRQLELRSEQVALIEAQLTDATQLVERGLATARGERELERQLADQQIRRLEIETARLNAEQRLNETRRDRLDLMDGRRLTLVEGLQDQIAAVGDLDVRMETQAALYAEAREMGTALTSALGEMSAEITVTRMGDDGPETTRTTLTDRVRGGDVLDIRLGEVSVESDLPAFGATEGLGAPGLSSGDARAEDPVEDPPT